MRKLRRNLQINRAEKPCDQAYLAKSSVRSSSYLVSSTDSHWRSFCAEQSGVDLLKLAGMAITAAVGRFATDTQFVVWGSTWSFNVPAIATDRPKPGAPFAYSTGKSPTEFAGVDEPSGKPLGCSIGAR